jgi:hypothetical protein
MIQGGVQGRFVEEEHEIVSFTKGTHVSSSSNVIMLIPDDVQYDGAFDEAFALLSPRLVALQERVYKALLEDVDVLEGAPPDRYTRMQVEGGMRVQVRYYFQHCRTKGFAQANQGLEAEVFINVGHFMMHYNSSCILTAIESTVAHEIAHALSSTGGHHESFKMLDKVVYSRLCNVPK